MEKKRHILPVFGSQLTSTVSVMLVLFILGLVGLLGIAAREVTDNIRELTGFVAIVKSDATPQQINNLKRHWMAAPYVADVKFASADEVMRRWRELTGDDALPSDEELGGNPFFPEFEVNLRADYALPDSIAKYADAAAALPGVGEVKIQADTVEAVNATIRSVMLVLGVIACVLMLISFVLINNTVRLAIYSRRFIIHTMKLVGATAGFIRRPFVVDNLLGGLVAALVAVGLLAALLAYGASVEPDLASLVPWDKAAWVFGAMIVTGTLLSGLAALIGANRYIRISYDDMF